MPRLQGPCETSRTSMSTIRSCNCWRRYGHESAAPTLTIRISEQLHVARLTKAKARSAAAISSVANQAETARVERGRGIGVIGPVKRVQDFNAELRRIPIG